MGLGTKICEFSASLFVAQGGKVYIKTINPALGVYHNKSDIWRGTTFNGKISQHAKYDKNAKGRLERVSYCHEYVGEGLSGYEELLKPIKEMRDNNKLKLEL